MARETSDCLATVSRTKLISGSRKVKSRDPRRSRLCHRNASHRDWIQHYWISLSVLCTGEELLLGARARDRERERESAVWRNDRARGGKELVRWLRGCARAE